MPASSISLRRSAPMSRSFVMMPEALVLPRWANTAGEVKCSSMAMIFIAVSLMRIAGFKKHMPRFRGAWQPQICAATMR